MPVLSSCPPGSPLSSWPLSPLRRGHWRPRRRPHGHQGAELDLNPGPPAPRARACGQTLCCEPVGPRGSLFSGHTGVLLGTVLLGLRQPWSPEERRCPNPPFPDFGKRGCLGSCGRFLSCAAVGVNGVLFSPRIARVGVGVIQSQPSVLVTRAPPASPSILTLSSSSTCCYGGGRSGTRACPGQTGNPHLSRDPHRVVVTQPGSSETTVLGHQV